MWKMLDEMKCGRPRIDAAFERGRVKDVVIDEQDVSIWLEDGKVMSVSVIVPYDERDRPIWPEE